MKLSVSFRLFKETITLKKKMGNRISFEDVKIPKGEIEENELLYVNARILNFLKPAFYQMPFEDVYIDLTKEVSEKIEKLITSYRVFLGQTNTAIQGVIHLKKKAVDHSNILFFETEKNSIYTDFFNRISKKSKNTVCFEIFDTGFNAEKRRWEKPVLPFSIPELVDYLMVHKIKAIFSINQYLLELYLNHTGVYLLALFDMLGVEYVCIDHDNQDANLMKGFYNNNSFRRFSLRYFESELWDKKYGLTNVLYPTIPQATVNKDAEFVEIDDDYKIVILSFSRLNIVAPKLASILYVLEHFDQDELFSQFQLWHYSTLYMIRGIIECSELERLNNYKMVNLFSHAITQLLKFEIIEGLKTDRKIEIYGDTYWQHLFPEYYKGWLKKREEIDDLFAKKNCLHLLLNWAPTIFTSNPHLYGAINRKNPFVCYAPLVKTEKYKGFAHIEYDNVNRVNHLVNNIKQVFKNPELLEAIKNHQQLMKTSSQFFENSIIEKEDKGPEERFQKNCHEHKKALDHKIYGFLDGNDVQIRQIYQNLFKEAIPINLANSKFIDRDYIQRILKLTAENPQLFQ
ncbi:MAG: hypothetical protein GY729_09645 [Desulfobacteraceae bacterium]|nr:hypothetical protein [Desulfobacteraceae bacterium]